MCVAVEVGCNWRAKVFVNARVMICGVCGQVHGWWGGDNGCMCHSTAVPDGLTQYVYRRVISLSLSLSLSLSISLSRTSLHERNLYTRAEPHALLHKKASKDREPHAIQD